MHSLLETSIFTAFQRFDYRDGILGLGLLGKSGKASNGTQFVRKRTILDTLGVSARLRGYAISKHTIRMAVVMTRGKLMSNGTAPWQNMDTIGFGVYGDGSLLYPGKKVGIDGPVSSLRLEVLRDGLEDFDYVAMADRLLGPDITKGYVARIARNLTDYERDPMKLEQVRHSSGPQSRRRQHNCTEWNENTMHRFHLSTQTSTSCRPQMILSRFGLFFLCTLIAQLGVTTPVESAEARRIAELPVKPAFTPLPIGTVEPAGWLRDWALAARNGITGHLDENAPTFHEAWKGSATDPKLRGGENLIASQLFSADATGGPLGECSYWLDGALRLGYVLHDDALIKKVTDRLNLVVNGVNHGGNSFIYWKKEPPEGFNNWSHAQLGRGLVAWYEATGERRILDALAEVYRQYRTPMGKLEFADSLTNWCPVSGLCNVDPMLDTYSFSGDPRLLDRVRAAIAAPDVQATVDRWLKNDFAAGHAVCAHELICLPALFYLATGEPRYLQASFNAFRWLDENHMLPYGVASGEEHFSGIGAFRLTETCNVTADIWSMIWLYRIAGQQTWGDRIEHAFFNAAPAPIARDFQTMCYYQSPNRILGESLPAEQPKSPGRGCLRYTRLGYPHTLCCVGAVNRIVPSYIMHMWMATGDGGLAATLYGPCSVSAMVGAKIPVKLTCETAYPFEESIRVKVEPDRAASWPLTVPHSRLVQQAADCDQRVGHGSEAGWTWLRLHRAAMGQGRHGDAHLPHVGAAGAGLRDRVSGIYPKILRLQERRGFSAAAFALRERALRAAADGAGDSRQGSEHAAVGRAVAVCLGQRRRPQGADIKIERKPMPATWDWPLDAPLALHVPARSFDWRPTETQALPGEVVEGDATDTIRLIPYGCTKFRISMFPVTVKVWGN